MVVASGPAARVFLPSPHVLERRGAGGEGWLSCGAKTPHPYLSPEYRGEGRVAPAARPGARGAASGGGHDGDEGPAQRLHRREQERRFPAGRGIDGRPGAVLTPL